MPYIFSKPAKTLYALFLMCAIVVCTGKVGYAQSLGDPLVKITFGTGFQQYGGALRADSGFTDYKYVNVSPEDNEYTIANTTMGMNRAWLETLDHTGNQNGYMMVVNAAYTPGLFYTRKVGGLCGGTTYQFSAWIKNLMKTGGIQPNITFKIEDPDGNLLLQGSTDNINNLNEWREFAYVFKTSPSLQTVVLKMINNAPGGGGNDLAIDDITFRPYGQTVQTAFSNSKISFCEGVSEKITMKAITPLQPGYALKFQQYVNKKWEDMSTASTQTEFTFDTPTAPGVYNYRMITSDAVNIDVASCVVASNTLAIAVTPLPVAAMQAPLQTCEGEPTAFSDKSTAQGAFITSWKWDFGDGSAPSAEANPVHTYNQPGDFYVSLTVTNSNGCTSAIYTNPVPVHIVAKAKAGFQTSSLKCETQAITFTDISTSADGNIISRVWDFDDGGPTVTKDDATPFTHTFAEAKTYNVKLTINTDKDCSVTTTVPLKVNALPAANFILPELCFADYYANFKDSTFIDGDNAGFTYLWNFGDSDASPGNLNTSDQQNPRHHYSRLDIYTVTLTVTTADGCTFTKTKDLQINGSPQPKFVVKDESVLCANKAVAFENQSTATTGKVARIIMYYDIADRTIMDVDEDPYPGKVYQHLFAAGTYTVEMHAFTGDANVCEAVTTATITVAPAPAVALNIPEYVCLNNGPVTLTYTESSGLAGAPVFSGNGVNGNIFNPLTAGIGTWPITFIYTTTQAAGCADTLVQNITVKPIPTSINAGPDFSILAGSSATIKATATGNSLKYKWTPATGLSSDTVLTPVVLLVDNNVTYKLRVTVEDGTDGPVCALEDSVTVVVLKKPEIPNAFTPNGDGINDTWEIKNLKQYEMAVINIYNRYGQRVYTSVGYNVPWDGRLNGINMPVGVYYYIIDPKRGWKPVTGYVTIIR